MCIYIHTRLHTHAYMHAYINFRHAYVEIYVCVYITHEHIDGVGVEYFCQSTPTIDSLASPTVYAIVAVAVAAVASAPAHAKGRSSI